uniref:Uncharacterized protein n=1 Tax=Chenopodium quinoa TaxID=63459 RepID=A0A803MDQ3_CHEQI
MRKRCALRVPREEVKPWMPITLGIFFPRNYFSEASVDVVSCYTAEVKDGSEENQPSTSLDHSRDPERDSKILALLDIVPARMGWRQALSLPEEIASLAFTDENLMLGSKPHNRPIFVCGYIRKQKVNRILIDGGSAVNIMPKYTMRKLGITDDELSQSRLMIQVRVKPNKVESKLSSVGESMTSPVRRVSNQKISNPPSASLENKLEMPSARKEGFDPVA